MNGKKGLVPKLRFPEFQDAEAWKLKTLGEISKITTGSSNREDSTTRSGAYTFFDRSQDIRTSNIYLFDGEAVIVAGEGQEFMPKYFVGKFDLHQRTYAIMDFQSCCGLYLFYYIYQFRAYFLAQAVGSTVKSLRLPMFQNMPIGLPAPKEQKKIAECLSSVDELIAAQARKVDALKTHKKGLMQQLFPREGETQPRLGFPAFRSAGEWKPTSFGALRLDVSDGNYSSKYPSQSDFTASGVPFLRANNLKFGTVSDDDMRFISMEQHRQITKGHLKKGDILITTRGELGTVALVPDRHIGSNINAQIVRINSGNKLVTAFLFQLLDYSRVIGLFDALSTGTALKQLPIGKLNQLALRIPEILDEQQRIASCLSSLDALITAETQKLEVLKTHKKGLMQQLFPSAHMVEV
jgi:type I restriction enzyme, S subunit